MKSSQLLSKLNESINQNEWSIIQSKDSSIKISEHNRNTLLEMRKTQILQDKELPEDIINNLETQLKNYLNKYMKEDEKDHKWIIISSLFLTYIKELPMHPIDKLKIKIVIENDKKIYYCPYKSNEGVCKYCVCRPKS